MILCVKQCSALHNRVEQKIIIFHFGNQFNKRCTLYVISGLDVLGQSPRPNICAFIELSCYLDCFIKIAYIMLNKYSDSDSVSTEITSTTRTKSQPLPINISTPCQKISTSPEKNLNPRPLPKSFSNRSLKVIRYTS